MTTKTYIDFTTPAVDAAWLNDVDRLLYDILGNPADDAAVVSGLGITSTIAELNILDGVTATATELNYVDGVTSAIQTQLNAKALLAGSASQAFATAALTSTSITAPSVTTSKTTVASATTPDIFAVTTGQLIDYTGTATCTGFVAAPQAGMFRELYCAGACLFTAGANLLIEGIPSGTTITLAAGALVQVRAITTTQFKMTYSYTGSYTATWTGFSSGTVTFDAKYSVHNGVVVVDLGNYFGTGGSLAVSNATNFTITGAPTGIRPGVGGKHIPVIAQDNGTAAFATLQIGVAGGTDTWYVALGAVNYPNGTTTFTASGTKGLLTNQITYTLS